MKTTDDIEHSQDCGADRTLIHCWQEGKAMESLGKSLAVSNEVNQTSTLSSSNSVPKYLHKSNVDVCPQRLEHEGLHRVYSWRSETGNNPNSYQLENGCGTSIQ